MEIFSYLLSAVLIITTFGLKETESGLISCGKGEFLDATKGVCKTCSVCPSYEIIRKTCTDNEDTICGPFLEFNEFLQANAKKNATSEHQKSKHDSKLTTEPPKPSTGTQSKHQLDLTSVSSGEQQWKTLAMGLIGVLCIVSVFLAIFVMAVCYVRHRHPIVEKDVIYDPELLQSSSDTYIKIQPYMAQRDRLKTNSQHVNHSDYDSCSEESYPCAAVPSSSRLLAPVYIPPVYDEYDADHSSGVSTIKSSDYVYFNCPQNGNSVA